MLKRTITYTDYNGVERKEDHYFNLTKVELLEFQTSITGGQSESIEEFVMRKNISDIMGIYKRFILESYGEKSTDGRRFIKSKEISQAFAQTEAYSILFMELLNDEKKFSAFLKGVIPSDIAEKLDE